MAASARKTVSGRSWGYVCRRVASSLIVGVIVLGLPAIAEACPVCYGDIDGPAARGVNNGILTMLGVVFAVQLGFVGMFVGMWRRSKRLQERKEAFKVIDGGAS